MPPPERSKYWFPAKRLGWGWGLPSAWQGWVVFVSYLVLVLGGIAFLDGAADVAIYVAYVLALTVVLVLICWRTGERPRWRG